MKYGDAAASTRQRLTQFIPYLQAKGISTEVHHLFNNAYVNTLAAGRKQPILPIASSYIRRALTLLGRRNFDVLFTYLDAFPGLPLDWLTRLCGKPIVYDADDAIFHRYDGTALAGKLRPLWRGSHAICGNRYIAARIAPHARSVTIIPTVVDTDEWRPRLLNSHPVIGWIGSPSTWQYVEPLLPVIRAACERHDATFRVVGARAAGDHPWIDARPWSRETEVASVQSMTLGIMPLPDTRWARGKCGFKLLQYMACGLPVIGSPVGVNSEIIRGNGLLAATGEEWAGALDRLLASPDMRRAYGRRGREKVVAHYSLRSAQERLLNVIQRAYCM